MGKSKKPKIEVTRYYLSSHFGICLGEPDALLEVKIKEKVAYGIETASQSNISINLPELFGGEKKEGGAVGTMTYLPGGDSQVMPDLLAQKLGRSGGSDCPGFRGLASIFFYGSGGRGFYWTANTPFLPGVWAKVRRAPVGLDPNYALIYSGVRTPRAVCFALDRSTSMAGTRLATLKAAMATVLELVSASANSGVQIDISVVTFGDPSQTITRRSIDSADVDDVDSFVQALTAGANDTDFRAGMNSAKTFFDATSSSITERFLFFITDGEPSDQGGDSAATVASEAAATLATLTNVESYAINIELLDTTYTSQVDNTPSDGVPIIDEDDQSGLVSAVITALFGDGVVADANPAHIIYECLTNTDWGMGSPTSAIDYDAFDAASQTLFAESFGLSMVWAQQASIQDFVQEVLDHIQGVLYVDPATGLITLDLIRGDYDESTLDVLDPDNADLTNFSRKLWGDIVNEIVVTWTNPENEQEETITVQDNASIAIQGGLVSDSRNYYGVRNAALAQSLAFRDLRSAGQPLASAEVEVDRSQYALRPGSVIKLTWPEYGLTELVMRVQSVDYGKIGDPTIKANLIEDVYGLAIGSYDEAPDSAWVDPSADPEDMDPVKIITLPYFMAANSGVGEFIETPEYPEVVAGILASTDNTDTFEYELSDEISLPNGDLQFQTISTNNVLGYGSLAAQLAAEITSTNVALSIDQGGTAPVVGGFVFLGDGTEETSEIAMVDADNGDGTYTLVRGVMDTVPRIWPAGTATWFVDESTIFEDPVVRSAAETVDYLLLSRTSQGLLAAGDATEQSATLTERPWLPNRPANVGVYDGTNFSTSSAPIDAALNPDAFITVTWANRNRLDEDSQILAWDDATQTVETGQTTTIEVRDVDGVLLATHDGLTGTTYNVPDSSYSGEQLIELRVYAERSDSDGDFVSLQYSSHWVLVAAATFDSGLITFDSDTLTWDQN